MKTMLNHQNGSDFQPRNESCSHNTTAWEDAFVNLGNVTHKHAKGMQRVTIVLNPRIITKITIFWAFSYRLGVILSKELPKNYPAK